MTPAHVSILYDYVYVYVYRRMQNGNGQHLSANISILETLPLPTLTCQQMSAFEVPSSPHPCMISNVMYTSYMTMSNDFVLVKEIFLLRSSCLCTAPLHPQPKRWKWVSPPPMENYIFSLFL